MRVWVRARTDEFSPCLDQSTQFLPSRQQLLYIHEKSLITLLQNMPPKQKSPPKYWRDLPPDLKDAIYEYLIPPEIRITSTELPDYFKLLRLCSQIRSEALQRLHSLDPVFVVEAKDMPLLRSLSESYTQPLVRRVEMEIHIKSGDGLSADNKDEEEYYENLCRDLRKCRQIGRPGYIEELTLHLFLHRKFIFSTLHRYDNIAYDSIIESLARLGRFNKLHIHWGDTGEFEDESGPLQPEAQRQFDERVREAHAHFKKILRDILFQRLLYSS